MLLFKINALNYVVNYLTHLIMQSHLIILANLFLRKIIFQKRTHTKQYFKMLL